MKTKVKIKPNEIAFDIDEVVSLFIPVFLRVLKEDTGIEISLNDINDFEMSIVPLPKRELRKIINKAVNNPITLGMKMVPGAKEVIIKLLDKGPVYFVTARKNGKLIKEWIDKELEFSSDQIIVVAMNSHDSKVNALKKRGIKWFVDDRMETCYQLYDAGLYPILFTYPHNIGDVLMQRVNNWKEIDKLIDWE